MSVLVEWALRRIRHQVRFWLQFMRLVLDWTVVVYMVLPGIAFAIYEGRRYYDGSMLANQSANASVLGPVTLGACMTLVFVIFVIVVHFSTFGKLMFPMQYGDRAFTLLAPIHRNHMYFVIWTENILGIYVLLAVVSALVYPLLPIIGLPLWVWILRMALLGIFVSSCRVIGSLFRQSESMKLKHWTGFQLTRFVLLLPPLVVVSRMSHPHLIWLWLMLLSTFLVAGLAWWMQKRLSWDPLYRTAPNRLVELFASPGAESKRPVFSMRAPSRLLAQWCDALSLRFRKRPVNPVVWLFILRMMRKRGIVWDYGRISAAGIVMFHIVPNPLLRIIELCFCVFLFYQYWRSSIAILYLVPAKEQSVTSRFAIEAAGRRITVAAVLVTVCWWVAAGLL